MEEEKNIIDQPDSLSANMPVSEVTHFSFMHPPGGHKSRYAINFTL